MIMFLVSRFRSILEKNTLIMATNLQHPKALNTINKLIGLITTEASAMMPTPFETAHEILVIILVVSLGQ